MSSAEDEAKPTKPSFLEAAGALADQAKVVSAFMRAFGFAIGKGLRGAKPLKTQVAAQIQALPDGISRLWGKHARLIIEEGIALLIDELQAELELVDPLAPLIPEKPEGYLFKIQSGRLAMDADAISTLMNRHAFSGAEAPPLSGVRVKLQEGKLAFEATFHLNRLISLPLKLVATVSVTTDGLIELAPREIRAGALPVDRLMGLLGLELERFMPAGGARAMTFAGDRVLINPLAMFPAPKATGRLVAVEISGEHLVMTYDDGTPLLLPPLLEPEADSYLAMVGHDLLVGKITMTDVCMQLVPLDAAAGWVELSLPQYRLQLGQGESHLNHADQLLYKLPPVAALKGALLPVPASESATRPSRSRPQV